LDQNQDSSNDEDAQPPKNDKQILSDLDKIIANLEM
jgi:hypothetical protein